MSQKTPKETTIYRLPKHGDASSRDAAHTPEVGLTASIEASERDHAFFAKNEAKNAVEKGSKKGRLAKMTLRVSRPYFDELERRVRLGCGERVSAIAAELLELAIDQSPLEPAGDRASSFREAGAGGTGAHGFTDEVDRLAAIAAALQESVIRQEKATETLAALLLYSALRLQDAATSGRRPKAELKAAAYAEAKNFLSPVSRDEADSGKRP